MRSRSACTRVGEAAIELPKCLSMCGVRACIDQIADCFGLQQIELAVQYGAASEFACFGLARSGSYRSSEHCGRHTKAAMGRDLEKILAGERVRRAIERGDDLVEHTAVIGVDDVRADWPVVRWREAVRSSFDAMSRHVRAPRAERWRARLVLWSSRSRRSFVRRSARLHRGEVPGPGRSCRGGRRHDDRLTGFDDVYLSFALCDVRLLRRRLIASCAVAVTCRNVPQ